MRWTPEDDACLLAMRRKKLSDELIGTALNRTPDAIKHRIGVLTSKMDGDNAAEYHHSHGPSGCWNDHRTKQLKTFWAEGLSAGQIASRLGVSRNSVIGKVHRLGLPGRTTSSRMKSQKRPRAAKCSQPNSPFRNPYSAASEKCSRQGALMPAALPDPAFTDVGRVAFTQAMDHHCRWIVGDTRPNAMCCGVDQVPGQSYCLDHLLRAFQPPASPRKKTHWRHSTQIEGHISVLKREAADVST